MAAASRILNRLRCGWMPAHPLLAALLVVGITLFIAGAVTLPSYPHRATLGARVLMVRGLVQARPISSGKSDSSVEAEWNRLAVGDTVPAGHEVVTGPDSQVELEIAGPARVVLGPAAAVVITAAGVQPSEPTEDEPNLFVSVGTVLVHVLRDAARVRRFVVETPTAVAGVRGTVFDVRVEPDLATYVSVWEGSVAVQAVQAAPAVQAISAEQTEPAEPVAPAQPTARPAAARQYSSPVLVEAGQEVHVPTNAAEPVRTAEGEKVQQAWTARSSWLEEQKAWEAAELAKRKAAERKRSAQQSSASGDEESSDSEEDTSGDSVSSAQDRNGRGRWALPGQAAKGTNTSVANRYPGRGSEDERSNEVGPDNQARRNLLGLLFPARTKPESPGRGNKSDNDRDPPGRNNRDDDDREPPGRSNRDDDREPPGRSNRGNDDRDPPGRNNRDDDDREPPGRSNRDDNDRESSGRSNWGDSDRDPPGRSNRDDDREWLGRGNWDDDDRDSPGRSRWGDGDRESPGRNRDDNDRDPPGRGDRGDRDSEPRGRYRSDDD